ncbi:unnamed protein product [Rotaria socialis]|uniref:CBM1 domain-containing protein n=1 Tax=Rotaria socialis TaxID=392032 RepID=A0A820KRS8_9BILA|nr:unnamed protein product [Rotaria socialis]CAF3325232.1 unnamed protein product [Rotaria socialis]CAF3538590.1 unnamed protein product [Rotaria socialis]CAF3695187.1 unnamed protein product [Rotaria socialis]CAF3719518.1 unnamed protein product [Rotaria socialis]
MLKSILIIFTIFIKFINAQQNILDDRYGNRIPQQPSYFSAGYGVNLPSSNINMNNINNNNMNAISSMDKDGLIEEFGQCGGLDWEGPKICKTNFICMKRSKYYSQCLSAEAAAIATRPSPQVIPPGGKCHGGNIRSPLACATGTACFIQTENIHGECKTHCPQGWFCAKQTLSEWAPCGGESYVGLTKCKEGLHCYPHSRWYHECRSECPEGWSC